MLTLISATPGSGKTLKTIEIIFDLLNKGYLVYANIIGLKVPGVFPIDSYTDWRDLDHIRLTNPEYEKTPIAVIYDEAHEHPAFAEKNLIPDKQKLAKIREIGESLSMHRHFGFDIYLITQSPRKLAPYVLADVGRHLYLRRVFKFKRATIYEFPEAQTQLTKSTRKDALVKTDWKFPEHLYHFYVSTEVDTHQTEFPLKYMIFLGFFVLFIIYILYRVTGLSFFNNDPKESETASKTVPTQVEPSSTPTEKKSAPKQETEQQAQDFELKRVAMVIETSSDCYAKNSYGEYIDMSVDQCRLLSKNNKGISMSRIKPDYSHLPTDYSASTYSSGNDQNFNGFSTKPIAQTVVSQ